MPQNYEYLRQCSLVVSSATTAVELGNFRCVFTVKRGDAQTPNSLDVRVYNLKPATANMLSKTEFNKISLSAGYAANFGLIFTGNIIQFRQGRLNQTDSFIDITAADGDQAYNYATTSVTLPAGTPIGSMAQMIQKDLARKSGSQPITMGYSPNFPASQLVRGSVMFGMTRDVCRNFAAQNNVKWSIQSGALTFIPYTSYIPGGAIPVISVSSGLIGVPEQTQAGINIRTLLNPTYKVGQLIQLNSQINQFRFGLDRTSQVTNPAIALQNKIAPNLASPTSTNPSDQQGLYYVMVNNFTGDTRGQPWWSDIVALAVDSTLTNAGDQNNALFFTAPAPIARYGGT